MNYVYGLFHITLPLIEKIKFALNAQKFRSDRAEVLYFHILSTKHV